MAELDFDELDRAVNSLMSKAPVTVPTKQDDDLTTVELPGGGDMPTAPQDVTDNSSSEQATPEQPSTSVSTEKVTPRRGRFMDVIRPEDAKKAEKLLAPSGKPSRESKLIEPRSGGLIADIVKAPSHQPATPEVQMAPDTPVPSASETTEGPTTQDTPDAPKGEAQATPQPAPATDFSAFLPNAKVEKRPLGQPITTSHSNEDDAPAEVDAVQPPEEYDQQLMAIESGSTSAKSSEVVPATEELLSETEQSVVTTPPEMSSTPAAPASTPEVKSAGPVSIAQQYREQPSSSNQSNGAIYDTSTYHQPLRQPAKRSSGWLWVVVIIVIILVGAGAGAYFYLNSV